MLAWLNEKREYKLACFRNYFRATVNLKARKQLNALNFCSSIHLTGINLALASSQLATNALISTLPLNYLMILFFIDCAMLY